MSLLNPNNFKLLIDRIYRYRMVNRLVKDNINGKLNIILLLIMKLNRGMFNSYMINTDWSALQSQVRQMTKSYTLNLYQQTDMLFVDEIYHLLFMDQNSYGWKYDIQCFCCLASEMMIYQMDDQFMFKYANFIFVACTKNILRLYQVLHYELEVKGFQEEEGVIYPERDLHFQEQNYHKIIKKYHRPALLKKDYFQLYRYLIRKLKSTEKSH